MNYLNPVEQECQETLLQLHQYMTRSPGINRGVYRELLGQIRDLLGKLKNKEYGCWSGIHAGTCDCKEGHRGHSTQAR